jgi:cell division protease FtsH
MLPKEDRYYATRSELLDQLKTFLGGRVAEALVLDEISTGAQNDLERATSLARKMICEFGMSDALGPISFGHRDEQVFLGRDIGRDRNYSEEVAYAIDQEVRRIIEDAYAKTEEILKNNLDKLKAIAEALMVYETLEANQLEQLMKDGKIAENNNAEQISDPVSSGPDTGYVETKKTEPETAGETVVSKTIYISRL